MLTLKLQRIGKKKQPHFRLIAQEKGKNPKSKSVEILGWLNPRTKEKELKKERIEYWLSVGAKATDTVHNLLVSEKILKADKRKTFKISKKRLAKKEKKKKEIKKGPSFAKATADREIKEKENINQKLEISDQEKTKETTEEKSEEEK